MRKQHNSNTAPSTRFGTRLRGFAALAIVGAMALSACACRILRALVGRIVDVSVDAPSNLCASDGEGRGCRAARTQRGRCPWQ